MVQRLEIEAVRREQQVEALWNQESDRLALYYQIGFKQVAVIRLIMDQTGLSFDEVLREWRRSGTVMKDVAGNEILPP